jgi:hypothetical protein
MPELSKLVSDATAVLKKVMLSQNKLFGADPYGRHRIDADQSGWVALCDALPSSPVEELDVADVGMGAKAVTSLAKAISSMAALVSVNVFGNGLAGATKTAGWNGSKFTIWENIDSKMSGFAALCAVLGQLTEVNLSDCGLGPTSLRELAKVFRDASVALASFSISNNEEIGDNPSYIYVSLPPCYTALHPDLPQVLKRRMSARQDP